MEHAESYAQQRELRLATDTHTHKHIHTNTESYFRIDYKWNGQTLITHCSIQGTPRLLTALIAV